jgi:monothiol glutaredoxin
MTSSTEVFQEIQALIDENAVILFMKGTPETPQCGFSSFVCQVLKKLEISFVGVNILERAELRQGIKDFTNWPTVPQLYIKGVFVGGADIVRDMYQAGELQDLLVEHGLLTAKDAL